MKIILINPPKPFASDPTPLEVFMEQEDPMPPLGIMYLAAYLQKYTSHDVRILDCQLSKIDQNGLKKIIAEEKPDLVGITTMTFLLTEVIKTVNTIKDANPETKVVLGGAHVHIYPEETINIKGVDYCVLGEGEKPFYELVENYSDKKKLNGVKGLVFKEGDRIVNNGVPHLIQDLDSLPFPARQLVPYLEYTYSLAKRFPVGSMITSRGCPFRCLFCDRPHMGNVFRARSAENVVAELEECANLGINEVVFYDDTFTVNRQRVIDICNMIIEKQLGITWDIRSRVNTVDEKMINLLKEAGCQRIHFGIEAGTEKILKVLRKGITLEQAERAFHWAKKAGIETLAYFMIGSPTETREDIMATIRFAKKIKPDYVSFGILSPYPATDVYRLGLESGILPCDYWQEFAANPTEDFRPYNKFWNEILTTEELFALMNRAYKSFYFSPGYILRKVLAVRSWREFKSKAKAALTLLRM